MINGIGKASIPNGWYTVDATDLGKSLPIGVSDIEYPSRGHDFYMGCGAKAPTLPTVDAKGLQSFCLRGQTAAGEDVQACAVVSRSHVNVQWQGYTNKPAHPRGVPVYVSLVNNNTSRQYRGSLMCNSADCLYGSQPLSKGGYTGEFDLPNVTGFSTTKPKTNTFNFSIDEPTITSGPSATLTARCGSVSIDRLMNAPNPTVEITDIRTGAIHTVDVDQGIDSVSVPDDWYTAHIASRGKSVPITVQDAKYPPQGDDFYVGCGGPEPPSPAAATSSED
jgi:hypothetical protein